MIYMTSSLRLILILAFITGCASGPLANQSFNIVSGYIRGFPEFEKLEEDYFMNSEYSFLSFKIGRGPKTILILSKVHKGDIYEWVSRDNIRIYTKDGIVFKTIGMETDIDYQNLFLLKEGSFSSRGNFYNPDFSYFGYSIKFISKNENMPLTHREFNIGTLIKNTVHIPSIKWTTNIDVYEKDGKILRTHQKLHPLISESTIDFYFKY